MNMNKELNFVGAFPTERSAMSEPWCSDNWAWVARLSSRNGGHIRARMWCQMSKGSHTFMSR